MNEVLPAVGIGYALVDYKQRLTQELPNEDEITAQYLQTRQNELYVCAGGSVASSLVAYQRYSQFPTRLHYCISDDKRGAIFYEGTGGELGSPQIVEGKDSGYCLINLGEDGEIVDERTVPGIATSITIPMHELKQQGLGLVISNVNTLRNDDVLEQTFELLKGLDKRLGLFTLRLSGAHSVLATGGEARDVVDNLPATPDVVFSNAAELENLTGSQDTVTSLSNVLSDTRVMFVTRGDKDVLVRYEGDIYNFSTVSVEQVTDVSGAGDHFMGVALAEMMKVNQNKWSPELLQKAAMIGTQAAAKVITTMDSRLSRQDLADIERTFYDTAE